MKLPTTSFATPLGTLTAFATPAAGLTASQHSCMPEVTPFVTTHAGAGSDSVYTGPRAVTELDEAAPQRMLPSSEEITAVYATLPAEMKALRG